MRARWNTNHIITKKNRRTYCKDPYKEMPISFESLEDQKQRSRRGVTELRKIWAQQQQIKRKWKTGTSFNSDTWIHGTYNNIISYYESCESCIFWCKYYTSCICTSVILWSQIKYCTMSAFYLLVILIICGMGFQHWKIKVWFVLFPKMFQIRKILRHM